MDFSTKIKFFFAFVFIFSVVFAENEDNYRSIDRKSKYNVRPIINEPRPPYDQLEPESEEEQDYYDSEEDSSDSFVINQKKADYGWSAVTIPVFTTKAQPVSTTRVTEKPMPDLEHQNQGHIPGCRNISCAHGYRCDSLNLCPATCKLPYKKPCFFFKHKLGCVCERGYVLNEHNICVPHEECVKPPNNEGIVCNELCNDGKQCVCQNPCPATCADPVPSPCATLVCNPGCYTVCKKGFVLDKINGDCIPLQYCPNRQCIAPVCGQRDNEVFYECSTQYCKRTCADMKHWCFDKMCLKPGNFDCKPGHIRDLRTGRCVIPQQCNQPIRCERKDEVFYECDTRICQRTCQRPNPICPAICSKPGNCDCRPGTVRDVLTCRCVDPNESSCLAQRISDH